MEDPLIYRIPDPPDDDAERIARERDDAELDWLFENEDAKYNGE
jgi:hypothetical protein